MHEQMIGVEDAHSTYEYKDYYKILPQINGWGSDANRVKNGRKVPEGFVYSSNDNKDWMSKDELRTWIRKNKQFFLEI